MGSALSAHGSCMTYIKTQSATQKRRKRYASLPAETSRSLVLTETSLRGDNFRQLVLQHPEIRHVRVQRDDAQRWYPTDDDLRQLKAFRSLTAVDLTGCELITRKAASHLNTEQLKTLILSDCPKITDSFFDDIALFRQLEHLDVRGCFRITDRGIRALAALKFLRYLDISLCATDMALRACATAHCTSIKDPSVIVISKLERLETLQMEGCSAVSSEGWIPLVRLRNLTALNLSSTTLADESLKILRNFPELRSLDVANCYLSESQGLEQITSATKLTHLCVSRVPGVTDKFIQGLCSHLNLQYLDMTGCDHLSDICLEDIHRLSFLEVLYANACPGISGRSLSSLSSLSCLCSLHLSDAADVRCEDVLPLVALEQLELGSLAATDEDISKMSALKHLSDLTLHLQETGSMHQPEKIVGIRLHLLKNPNITKGETLTSSD